MKQPKKHGLEQPAITDFQSGRLYSLAAIAALFGRTQEWARLKLLDGHFPGAFQPKGGRTWCVPGEDVLAFAGRGQLEADKRAATVPTERQQRKLVAAALKKLKPQVKA